MLFNSTEFILFFILISTLYFVLPHRFRWGLLLAGSCYFYMSFIPVYILILFATILIDYVAGIKIEESRSRKTKKAFLLLSVVSVCGILFVFKYFNFFNQNVSQVAQAFHLHYPIEALRIILPIGLSFHTFQSLSYVIEVYKGNQKAERHFGIYALYVMYFPQLVAGPIERPQNLLHQFHEEKRFEWDRLRDGLSLSLWGLFKKVVVADSLALYVDAVYNSQAHHTGASLLVATYFFAIQIYCDFSGYSDIARGVSKIYGIELMKNFETPYFSRSVGEFWSRWHISLSTWFRDYVYVPMGGNRVPFARNLVNIFTVFLLSGFWHGANWTFIVWGGLHGTYLVAEKLLATLAWKLPRGIRALGEGALGRAWRTLLTFHLVLVAWVFFRAPNVGTALAIIRRAAVPRGPLFWDPILVQASSSLVLLLGLDLFNRRRNYWESLDRVHPVFHYSYALGLVFAIVLFGIDRGAQFIYFQF